MNIGLENWNLLAAVVLPIVVGLVTKKVASPSVKSVALLVLSAANALVAQAVDNAGLLTEAALRTGLTSLVVSIAMYYGVFKPTGVAEAAQNVAPNTGVG